MKDQKPQKPKDAAKGCALMIALALIVWFIIPDCSGNDSKETNENLAPSEDLLKIEAYNFSQDLIKEYLKSPSTADFPWAGDVKLLSLGDNRYYIDGYVDSQNGFGAMIRTQFNCWVVYERNVSITIENIDLK